MSFAGSGLLVRLTNVGIVSGVVLIQVILVLGSGVYMYSILSFAYCTLLSTCTYSYFSTYCTCT